MELETDNGGASGDLVDMDTNDALRSEATDAQYGENALDMQDDIECGTEEASKLPFVRTAPVEDDGVWQTWRLPEGVCWKRVLQQGEGLYGPGMRSECKLTVQGLPEFDPGLTVTLGEVASPLHRLLYEAVGRMKRTEVAEVYISGLRDTPGEFVFCVTLHDFVPAMPSWQMTPIEKCTAAKVHKEKGAQYFKAGNVYAAFAQFSAATKLLLSIRPFTFTDHGDEETDQAYQQLLCLCRLNLAACQIKMGHHQHVVTNCTHALEFDPTNVKALYRRAQAYASLGSYWLAQEDLQAGLRKEPTNRAIAELLQTVTQRASDTQSDLTSGMKKMFS